jgi:hypothetical protein
MKFDEIILKKEWMGHSSGTVLHVNPWKAQEMVSRGVAVYKRYAEPEEKDIETPPQDKMMKKAWRKGV